MTGHFSVSCVCAGPQGGWVCAWEPFKNSFSDCYSLVGLVLKSLIGVWREIFCGRFFHLQVLTVGVLNVRFKSLHSSRRSLVFVGLFCWGGVFGKTVSEPLLPVSGHFLIFTQCIWVTQLVLGFFQRRLLCSMFRIFLCYILSQHAVYLISKGEIWYVVTEYFYLGHHTNQCYLHAYTQWTNVVFRILRGLQLCLTCCCTLTFSQLCNQTHIALKWFCRHNYVPNPVLLGGIIWVGFTSSGLPLKVFGPLLPRDSKSVVSGEILIAEFEGGKECEWSEKLSGP